MFLSDIHPVDYSEVRLTCCAAYHGRCPNVYSDVPAASPSSKEISPPKDFRNNIALIVFLSSVSSALGTVSSVP